MADRSYRDVVTIPNACIAAIAALACLAACSKASEQGKSAPETAKQQLEGEVGHRRGHDNASAMMRNALACEPLDGPGKVAACQRACQLNHSNSCANWGKLIEASDALRARELYQRACVGGSGIGCQAQARHAAAAGEETRDQYYLDARRYHRVHCAQGYARSCSQLAQLFKDGLGGVTSADTGRIYRERACRLGRISDCQIETLNPAKQ